MPIVYRHHWTKPCGLVLNWKNFSTRHKDDRFFVKNLERVQGDERDSIILSIGYGKDRAGNLPYRFGPLLTEGGERRLNVAITRAKRRMTVVSSFDYRDMDPRRSTARGVELLRLYLEYAASGGKLLGDRGLTGVPLDAFEADVCDALAARGAHLLPQFGASGYRIDLVAEHPEKPGRLVLAIECDGASYHSVPTTRDRDRLRQQHLEALGWRFHRIWSTDWFLRREQEIERALMRSGQQWRMRIWSTAASVLSPRVNSDNGVPKPTELAPRTEFSRRSRPSASVAGEEHRKLHRTRTYQTGAMDWFGRTTTNRRRDARRNDQGTRFSAPRPSDCGHDPSGNCRCTWIAKQRVDRAISARASGRAARRAL